METRGNLIFLTIDECVKILWNHGGLSGDGVMDAVGAVATAFTHSMREEDGAQTVVIENIPDGREFILRRILSQPDEPLTPMPQTSEDVDAMRQLHNPKLRLIEDDEE